MAGRRKRMKSGTHPHDVRASTLHGEEAVQNPQIQPAQDAEELEFIPSISCSSTEPGSLASRCSVRLIHEVVSNFNEYKREIVKSLGFHGILHFPAIKQCNRRHALWLMSNVCVNSSIITIEDHISIKFSKEDVGYVLGIPSSGKKVLDLSCPARGAKKIVLDQYLGQQFKEQRSLKVVQELIEKQYTTPMSKEDEDTFRVAFVVFVVSNLLSPCSKHDYASIDYWNALQDPDSICSFDWSEFVICRLLEAVSKLKQDIANSIKFTNMTGCVTFLQVLYLDSLDLQGFVMDHKSVPRVRHFSHEKIRAMIAADNNFARHLFGDHDTTPTKLRDPSDCIYSWAIHPAAARVESRGSRLLAIWETAVAMVQLLNIPLEAAGPVFVAAADFQEQINSGLFVTGTQAIKFMSVLISIMIPYSRGFSYQACNRNEASDAGFAVLDSAISNGINFLSAPIRHKRRSFCQSVAEASVPSQDCPTSSNQPSDPSLEFSPIGYNVSSLVQTELSSLDGMPHYLDVDVRVATAMSQFYSLIRKLKPARGFDLNSVSDEHLIDSCCSHSILDTNIIYLPSPWALGYYFDIYDGNSSKLSVQLNGIPDDERPAIVHRTPKYIHVLASDLKAQLSGSCELELDLFDALIRCLRQADDELYLQFGQFRWRLFFESDFMECLMSGTPAQSETIIRQHLSINDVTYDISKCKMLFFPALLQCRWVCFVWSVESNVIYVFEPSYLAPVPECRLMAIERLCFCLKLAMHNLCESVFQGLIHRPTLADMRLVTLPGSLICPLNCSGALCAYFCRCFDTKDLSPKLNRVDPGHIYSKLLRELLRLKDNSGSLQL